MYFKLNLMLVSLLSLIVATSCFADFRGELSDLYNGEPIQYATIHVDELNRTVQTDENGVFTVKSGISDDLSISIFRLGYISKDVLLKSGISNKIELVPKPLGLEIVTLKSNPAIKPLMNRFTGDRLIEGLPSDVADVFANTPGYGVVRKGSYGADPVIRGFKREQLLVQVDGIGKMECACPNRMDPITAQIQPEDLNNVQVVNGPYSLRYGSTVGGMVNMQYDHPHPGEREKGIRVGAISRYESNGGGNIARASIEKLNDYYGLKVTGGYKQFSDYKDGEDKEVPSEYNVVEYTALGSVKASSNQMVDLLFRQSFAENIDYAGLPMDAAKDDATYGQLKWKYNTNHRKLQTVELNVYGSFVDHIMDNHNRPNYSMVDAVATTSTNTWGGRVEVMLSGIGRGVLFTGMDSGIISKRGTRTRIISFNPCSGQAVDPPATKKDAIWQDATSYTSGVFVEWQANAGSNSRIMTSLRMDMYQADIGDPSQQFFSEYGNNSKNESESFSAALAYDIKPVEDGELLFSLGHGNRFPSITELYINHLSVGQDAYEYFGNPELLPESNTQAEVAFTYDKTSYETRISAFYSYVTDAIYAEVDTTLSRLFLPCMDPQYSKRFVNIDDVRKWGFEWYTGFRLTRGLNVQTGLAYVWAQDVTRDEPLPEIPPFEFSWDIKYHLPIAVNSWVMLQGRHVTSQERTSEIYGELPSESFNLYHFRTGIAVTEYIDLTMGIRNMFNTTYYEYLNRNYKNQMSASPIYEPGRSFYIQVKVNI